MNPEAPAPLVSRRLLPAAALLAAALASTAPAEASVDRDNGAELALTIWDPVAQASYTKDLGIVATDFFNYAQQDAGYQQFWHINASDAAFAQLVSLGTSAASLVWAVVANDNDSSENPGERNIYTTLRQGDAAGVENPAYAKLVALTGSNLQDAGTAFNTFTSSLINAPAPYNTHGTTVDINGSSFSRRGQAGYFDQYYSWELGPGTWDDNRNQGITNKVGFSSWFYKLTNASYDNSEPILVDEFDNLGHDGYWGLAVDPSNNDFVLSYTLRPATLASMASTASGLARLAITDYRASIGTPHLVASAAGEFLDYAPLQVSAVPEPAGWAMSLAGLAAIGWLARRRRA